MPIQSIIADAPITRTGKIARLPRPIRTELNQRLADGEPGPHLLEWLNGLPETQAVLAAEFGDRPINEQNLSAWRQGGFVDWQRHQEARAWLRALAEEEAELKEEPGGGDLLERVTTLTLLALGRLVRHLPADASPEEERRVVFGVAKHLAALRRANALQEKARLAREERERAKAEEEKQWAVSHEERMRAMQELFGIREPEPAPGESSQIKVNQGSESEAGGAAAIPSQPSQGAWNAEPEAGPASVNQGESSQIKVDQACGAAAAGEGVAG